MERFNFSTSNLLLLVLAIYVIGLSIVLAKKVISNRVSLQEKKQESWSWTLIIGGYLTWIGLVTTLGVNGFFDVVSFPPRFALFFSAIVALSILLSFASIEGRLKFLKNIPVHWFIYFQSFRIVVEVVLWMLHSEGLVPVQMTFEGRNFDILVGLVAPIAGYFVRVKRNLTVGIAFNVFGLIALCNIITIVVIAFPSPFQVYDTIYLASYFPGIIIPSLLAPVATYVHILSLKQLLWERRRQQTTTLNGARLGAK